MFSDTIKFVWCYNLLCKQYMPDQHTNNNKGLYMKSKHTACSRDYNVEQILLYHKTMIK